MSPQGDEIFQRMKRDLARALGERDEAIEAQEAAEKKLRDAEPRYAGYAVVVGRRPDGSPIYQRRGPSRKVRPRLPDEGS
jgi:hypothetical protein